MCLEYWKSCSQSMDALKCELDNLHYTTIEAYISCTLESGGSWIKERILSHMNSLKVCYQASMLDFVPTCKSLFGMKPVKVKLITWLMLLASISPTACPKLKTHAHLTYNRYRYKKYGSLVARLSKHVSGYSCTEIDLPCKNTHFQPLDNLLLKLNLTVALFVCMLCLTR